jgi:hypothetical protein
MKLPVPAGAPKEVRYRHMSPKRVPALLNRIGCLSHPCDLDLLMFFHRHPRAVLTSESLALYVGHERSLVAQSLETLIAAHLLTRVLSPPSSVQMYLLASTGPSGPLLGWLDALLRLASTRGGRLAVVAALAERQAPHESTSTGGPEPPVTRRTRRDEPPAREVLEVGHAR